MIYSQDNCVHGFFCNMHGYVDCYECACFKDKSCYIELPCKVGDKVYSYLRFWRKEDGIALYQITNITITQNKKGVWTKKYRAMQVVNGKTIDRQLNFDFDELGKTVFLTREQAEQELLTERNDDSGKTD